jgi:hypothetical protein
MSDTLFERNLKAVVIELITHFNDELNSKETFVEIIKSLECKLLNLSEEHNESTINGALELLKNTGEPIGKILGFALTNKDLKINIAKSLN